MEELCSKMVCVFGSICISQLGDIKALTSAQRNHGELAEGWYDPDRLQQYAHEESSAKPKVSTPAEHVTRKTSLSYPSEDDEDDDEYGPALASSGQGSTRAGPSIPTMNDLALRRENDREGRESTIALAKASRRADAKLEKQRLDDLAPRAEAGTRERQLEKKRDLAASNKTFAESKGGGGAGSGMVEVNEADLLGGGEDDSVEGIKKRKMEEQRKLSERELRREEFARARREEMEQRKKDFTEKEEERTQRFIELAKRRFG